MYLKQDDVQELFREIATCTGPGSRLGLSHLTNLAEFPWVREMMRLAGAPWLSSTTTKALAEYIGPDRKVIASQERIHGRSMEGFAVVEQNDNASD